MTVCVHAFDSAVGRGISRLNEAYITLLPKRHDVVELRDLRPVSLVHSFGEIVSKLMAVQATPFISKMVKANQSAFIVERSIVDNFICSCRDPSKLSIAGTCLPSC